MLRSARTVEHLTAAVRMVEVPTPAIAAVTAAADVRLQRRVTAVVDVLRLQAMVVEVARAAVVVAIPPQAADHPTAAGRRTVAVAAAADMGGNTGIDYFPA